MPDAAPLWVALSAPAVRNLPFGRYRLANTLSRLSRAPFIARLPQDLGSQAFVCDLRDSICREVCFTGRYEPQETSIALRLLRSGMFVLDVGANWGYFSLVCGHIVGREGRVVAIEPDPRLHTMLRENVRMNGLDQIECQFAAAGAARGVAGFVGCRPDGGNWGLSHIALGGSTVDFLSDVVSLDELVEARGWKRVGLVKIDVEGAEADVLRGMAAGLALRRYECVLLECHPAQLRERHITLDQCVAPLRDAGYGAWQIDHSPEMHRRAARRFASPSEMLKPFDARTVEVEQWPHLLWLSPDMARPA